MIVYQIRLDKDGLRLLTREQRYPIIEAKGDSGGDVVPTGPWGPQIPYIMELFYGATDIMQNPPQYYPGSSIADPNATLTDSQNAITSYATDQQNANQVAIDQALFSGLTGSANPQLTTASGLTPELSTALGSMLTGGPQPTQAYNDSVAFLTESLNAPLNPNLQPAIDAATTSLNRQFTQQTVPGISSEATAYGQGGGTRQGIAEGIAAQSLGEDVANITSQLTYQAYQDQINQQQQAATALAAIDAQQQAQQLQAQQAGAGLTADMLQSGGQLSLDQMIRSLSMLPLLQSGNLDLLGAVNQVGLQQQSFDQAFLDDDVSRWYYNQFLPINMLAQYQSFVTGPYGSTVN